MAFSCPAQSEVAVAGDTQQAGFHDAIHTPDNDTLYRHTCNSHIVREQKSFCFLFGERDKPLVIDYTGTHHQ